MYDRRKKSRFNDADAHLFTRIAQTKRRRYAYNFADPSEMNLNFSHQFDQWRSNIEAED